MNLTTQFHLVSRLRTRGAVPTLYIYIYIYLHGVDWDNFKFSYGTRFAVAKVLSLKITVL
jgi:hypothetical protein